MAGAVRGTVVVVVPRPAPVAPVAVPAVVPVPARHLVRVGAREAVLGLVQAVLVVVVGALADAPADARVARGDNG